MQDRWLAALPVILLVVLSGCRPSPEDRAFFYSGWVNPQETNRAKAPAVGEPLPAPEPAGY